MRKITKDAVRHLLACKPFNRSNTKVDVVTNAAQYILFGHIIAQLNSDGTLHITDAGYPTVTTRERLNGLPNVSVTQRKGAQYLNGYPWDGSWVNVDYWNHNHNNL